MFHPLPPNVKFQVYLEFEGIGSLFKEHFFDKDLSHVYDEEYNDVIDLDEILRDLFNKDKTHKYLRRVDNLSGKNVQSDTALTAFR
ncbi:hypothetical protein [Candidatus Harpocratesius sp.]